MDPKDDAMNIYPPADTSAADHGFHPGRSTADRLGVAIALIVATVLGVVAAQELDSPAIGLVAGALLFAILAPVLAAR